jgi:L-lysine exporter family protein LysE/ArgO
VIDDAFGGFATGLSLIVAIGAQNAYLLRQGLRRACVGTLVAVCTLSDFALIIAGVSGIGVVVRYAPWALTAVRWLGVAFLTWYGLSSAWHARGQGSGLTAAPGAGREEPPPRVALRRMVALTWLNPHVYLDTVLLLGAIAGTRGPAGRWWFAVGACLASTVWFTGLGFGARLLAPLLARPRAWQVLDLLLAATMLVIATRLAVGG